MEENLAISDNDVCGIVELDENVSLGLCAPGSRPLFPALPREAPLVWVAGNARTTSVCPHHPSALYMRTSASALDEVGGKSILNILVAI
jgi:hypothetical protein